MVLSILFPLFASLVSVLRAGLELLAEMLALVFRTANSGARTSKVQHALASRVAQPRLLASVRLETSHLCRFILAFRFEGSALLQLSGMGLPEG